MVEGNLVFKQCQSAQALVLIYLCYPRITLLGVTHGDILRYPRGLGSTSTIAIALFCYHALVITFLEWPFDSRGRELSSI